MLNTFFVYPPLTPPKRGIREFVLVRKFPS
jgi:hypothetical protein